MLEELEQIAGRVHQRRIASSRPDARDYRNGIVRNEEVAEPFLPEELSVSQDVRLVSIAEEG